MTLLAWNGQKQQSDHRHTHRLPHISRISFRGGGGFQGLVFNLQLVLVCRPVSPHPCISILPTLAAALGPGSCPGLHFCPWPLTPVVLPPMLLSTGPTTTEVSATSPIPAHAPSFCTGHCHCPVPAPCFQPLYLSLFLTPYPYHFLAPLHPGPWLAQLLPQTPFACSAPASPGILPPVPALALKR